MTATAHTHRVFDKLQGVWPVTFATVTEADPQGLLDIFEGSDSTRDEYFRVAVTEAADAAVIVESGTTTAEIAGDLWANYLDGYDTDHDDECDKNSRTYRDHWDCKCKSQQYANNQRWGTELFEAIEQRIQELND